ncbi:hypothetical protein D3C80_1577440 [compost metagenome]
MNDRTIGRRYVDYATNFTFDVQGHVLDVVPLPVVANSVHFTSIWINMRMACEGTRECTVKAFSTHSAQLLIVQDNGNDTSFTNRQNFSSQADCACIV